MAFFARELLILSSYGAKVVCALMPKIPLSEGRYLFGRDPLAYANSRPDYPEELYQRLLTRCELGPGVSAFEIGAGTGLATRTHFSWRPIIYSSERQTAQP
jgi:hypothetical protein